MLEQSLITKDREEILHQKHFSIKTNSISERFKSLTSMVQSSAAQLISMLLNTDSRRPVAVYVPVSLYMSGK